VLLCVAQRKIAASGQGLELLKQSPVAHWFDAGSQLRWLKACGSENRKGACPVPPYLEQLSVGLLIEAVALQLQT